MLAEKQGRVTFDDVAGIDEAKEELEEIVGIPAQPAEILALGWQDSQGRTAGWPSGYWQDAAGPCDRGEAGVPFFTISGSDFVEMFVGVGASRVRDMF